MSHALRKSLTLVLALVLGAPAAAEAQAVAVFGAAEAAGDNTTLLLLGAAWSPGNIGWQPYVSALAYNLRFDAGAVDVSRNIFAPQAGLRYQNAVSATQIGGGYNFASDDDGTLGNFSAESESGPFVAVQWDHWGNGSHALEAIGTYGFDSNFLWSRLSGLKQLAPASPLYVGAEASLFGNTDSENKFWSTQFGPSVEWRFTPAFRLGLAAGLKLGLSPEENNGSDAYGRLSFLWLPTMK